MTLLKHRIETLRLRQDAPFPSEAESAQDAIRKWRYEQLLNEQEQKPYDDEDYDDE